MRTAFGRLPLARFVIKVSCKRPCVGTISTLALGLAMAVASLAGGCSVPPMNDWIYVDNTTDQPLVILVDGKEAATIDAGRSAKLDYPPGEYHFVVKSGEQVLLDEKKMLEPLDKFAGRRKYLLNPDLAARYHIYVLQYGGSRLGDAMESGLLSMQKDPKLRNQYLYRQLLKEFTLLPQTAWNDVTAAEYVLAIPPDSVVSRTGIEKKKVLARIDAADFARLKLATGKEHPKQRDVEALNELLDEVILKALSGPRAEDLVQGD